MDKRTSMGVNRRCWSLRAVSSGRRNARCGNNPSGGAGLGAGLCRFAVGNAMVGLMNNV